MIVVVAEPESRSDSSVKENQQQSEAPDSNCSHEDDDRLLDRFREGEEDAATELYLRYARRLQRLAERKTDPRLLVQVDPEGVVQSVFRTFFRRVTDGQYNVGNREDIWNLLLVMSLNKIRSRANSQRAAKRDATRNVPIDTNRDAQHVKALHDEHAFTVLRLTIDEILENLPESQREIVRMRIKGHDVKEIAIETGRAKRSVERILQNFRKSLKSSIGS